MINDEFCLLCGDPTIFKYMCSVCKLTHVADFPKDAQELKRALDSFDNRYEHQKVIAEHSPLSDESATSLLAGIEDAKAGRVRHIAIAHATRTGSQHVSVDDLEKAYTEANDEVDDDD